MALSLASRGLAQVPRALLGDDAVALRLPSTLTRLDLSRNSLDAVPQELYVLVNLRALNLSRNKLKSIAPGISALAALESLDLVSNHLKLSTIPLDELASLTRLTAAAAPARRIAGDGDGDGDRDDVGDSADGGNGGDDGDDETHAGAGLDLRFNKKLEKLEANRTLRALLGARVRIGRGALRARAVAGSGAAESIGPTPHGAIGAGSRDATLLRSQLEPLSTPQLRRRLADVFGQPTDADEVDRGEVMARLLTAYAADPDGRRVRRLRGTPVAAELVAELLNELTTMAWPTTTRERPRVRADTYFTLQRPRSGRFASEHTEKARRAAAKLARYQTLWDLAHKVMSTVDAAYAEQYSAIAVTHNFQGSPHIDTENVGPFYGMSLGEFTPARGGAIAVEYGPRTVAHVDTRGRLGKVDGRFPHWVTPYEGTRYSVIYYRTEGAPTPMTSAVFAPFEAE